MNYDIIGDIHGHAGALTGLLTALGYRERAGAWRHPERQALFVGDFVDRGPEQLKVIRIVRAMVEAGAARAVMGNHELNAVAWHTENPLMPGDFLRTRQGTAGAKNRRQHAAFLAEVEHDPKLHRDVTDWFLTLPIMLELPEVRVVHACWDTESLQQLAPYLHQGCLSRESLQQVHQPGTAEFKALEIITKGVEITLPDGHSYADKEGHVRTQSRTRWWDANARTYRDVVMLSRHEAQQLPDIPVPEVARPQLETHKPIFFGHYWLSGEPEVLAPTMACVDYSVARDGALVAYRYDGEPVLNSSKFVSYRQCAVPACATGV